MSSKVIQIFQWTVLFLKVCENRQISTFQKSQNAKQSNGDRALGLRHEKTKSSFCKYLLMFFLL